MNRVNEEFNKIKEEYERLKKESEEYNITKERLNNEIKNKIQKVIFILIFNNIVCISNL